MKQFVVGVLVGILLLTAGYVYFRPQETVVTVTEVITVTRAPNPFEAAVDAAAELRVEALEAVTAYAIQEQSRPTATPTPIPTLPPYAPAATADPSILIRAGNEALQAAMRAAEACLRERAAAPLTGPDCSAEYRFVQQRAEALRVLNEAAMSAAGK